MSYYVSLVPRDSTYKDFLWNKTAHGDRATDGFIEHLKQTGIEASLFEGGWSDFNLKTVQPHLIFESAEMASIYVLKFGGVVLRMEPVWE